MLLICKRLDEISERLKEFKKPPLTWWKMNVLGKKIIEEDTVFLFKTLIELMDKHKNNDLL